MSKPKIVWKVLNGQGPHELPEDAEVVFRLNKNRYVRVSSEDGRINLEYRDHQGIHEVGVTKQ